MRYNQIQAFQKHLNNSAPSHFSPLYSVLMKEPAERSFVVSLFKKKLPAKEHFQYSSRGYRDLIRDLNTPSFLGGPFLYHLSDVEDLSKEEAEKVSQAFTRLPKNTTLLLSGEPIFRGGALYKAIEKEGVLLDIGEEKPWEKEKGMTEWLFERSQEAGFSFKPDAANALVRGAACNFAILASEWDKLTLYMGDKKEIELADVLAICVLSQMDSTWLLGETILERNPKIALELAFRSLDRGDSIFPMLRQIRHQFMTAIHLVSGTMEMISTKYPYLKGSNLEKQLSHAKNFGLPRLLKALQLIDYYEFKAKDGFDDPKLMIQMFITRATL